MPCFRKLYFLMLIVLKQAIRPHAHGLNLAGGILPSFRFTFLIHLCVPMNAWD